MPAWASGCLRPGIPKQPRCLHRHGDACSLVVLCKFVACRGRSMPAVQILLTRAVPPLVATSTAACILPSRRLPPLAPPLVFYLAAACRHWHRHLCFIEQGGTATCRPARFSIFFSSGAFASQVFLKGRAPMSGSVGFAWKAPGFLLLDVWLAACVLAAAGLAGWPACSDAAGQILAG